MKRTPWFRSWFGDEYLALYPHRDSAEAREAVELLARASSHGPGARVLDLACGAGRHLAELARIGYRATGLDLSLPLLRTAHEESPSSALVRGDMRLLPFRSATFDVVTSYFTSFGYFDDEEDDGSVLSEVRRILHADGCFLLDFLNAREVADNLRTEDRRTVSGLEVVQERSLVDDGRIVEKRITIGAYEGEPEREFVERVRLYDPEELDAMLADARLHPGQRFGGYDGSPFTSASPRYIVMGRAF